MKTILSMLLVLFLSVAAVYAAGEVVYLDPTAAQYNDKDTCAAIMAQFKAYREARAAKDWDKAIALAVTSDAKAWALYNKAHEVFLHNDDFKQVDQKDAEIALQLMEQSKTFAGHNRDLKALLKRKMKQTNDHLAILISEETKHKK